MIRPIAHALTLLASAALAETPLSAEAFEDYVTGKTLTYSSEGRVFGIEEYLRNRHVRWSFLDGECEEGVWYPVGEMICFSYESYPQDQCWTFFLRNGRLIARYENDPETLELAETAETRERLECPGPKVGV